MPVEQIVSVCILAIFEGLKKKKSPLIMFIVVS